MSSCSSVINYPNIIHSYLNNETITDEELLISAQETNKLYDLLRTVLAIQDTHVELRANAKLLILRTGCEHLVRETIFPIIKGKITQEALQEAPQNLQTSSVFVTYLAAIVSTDAPFATRGITLLTLSQYFDRYSQYMVTKTDEHGTPLTPVALQSTHRALCKLALRLSKEFSNEALFAPEALTNLINRVIILAYQVIPLTIK